MSSKVEALLGGKHLNQLILMVWLMGFAGLAHSVTPITINFDQAVKQKAVTQFSIELGGYDVTEFSQFSSDSVIVQLDTPLDTGEYQALISVFYEDGEVQTLVDRQVYIEGGQSVAWQGNVTFNVDYRVDEEEPELFEDINERHGNGGVVGAVEYKSGGWTVNASLQGVYDSHTDNQPTGNLWELPDYKVSAAYKGKIAQGAVAVGNTMVQQNNLLFGNYQRRGVSAYAASNNGLVDATAFSLVSNPTTSTEENLVVAEDENTSVGGMVQVRPLSSSRDDLVVGVGYLDGKGSVAGSGIYYQDPDTVYGGRAVNASVDAFLFSRGVWLHLEGAQSAFDIDGVDQGENAVKDNAHHVQVQFSSQGEMPALGMDYWSLTLSNQKVGRDFFSMGNLQLPGDLLTNRVLLAATKGALNVSAELAKETNNVDDVAIQATQTIDYASIDFTYSPFVDSAKGVWAALGAPAFNGYVRRTNTYQKDSDAAITGIDVDNLRTEYSGGVTFNKERLSWGGTLTYSLYTDNSEEVTQNNVVTYTPLSDARTQMVSVFANWMPFETLTLSPQWQRTSNEETDAGSEYVSNTIGMDVQWAIIPEKLFLNLNYFLTHDDNQYEDPLIDDSEFRQHTGTFKIQWTALQPKGLQPGTDVYLSGSYGKQEDVSNDFETETWQIYAGITLGWAGAGQ